MILWRVLAKGEVGGNLFCGGVTAAADTAQSMPFGWFLVCGWARARQAAAWIHRSIQIDAERMLFLRRLRLFDTAPTGSVREDAEPS